MSQSEMLRLTTTRRTGGAERLRTGHLNQGLCLALSATWASAAQGLCLPKTQLEALGGVWGAVKSDCLPWL